MAELDSGAIPGIGAGLRLLDTVRLEAVVQDLIACRQLLDQVLKG